MHEPPGLRPRPAAGRDRDIERRPVGRLRPELEAAEGLVQGAQHLRVVDAAGEGRLRQPDLPLRLVGTVDARREVEGQGLLGGTRLGSRGVLGRDGRDGRLVERGQPAQVVQRRGRRRR